MNEQQPAMVATGKDNPGCASVNGSAASCDWKYFSDNMKRCKDPATTINPPTGLKYCAAHTRRFRGMEDLVPIKPPNVRISDERP